MELRTVTTVRDLVEVLGGPKAAGDTLDATPQMVVNWRADNVLPARKYLFHKQRLNGLGIDAPPTLWGMVEAAE